MCELKYGGISYNSRSFTEKIEEYRSDSFVERMQHTTIYNLDFMEFLRKCPPANGDFLFLDPPYDTEFSSYDGMQFGKEEQIKLSEYLINECECSFMLVIKSTGFIDSLYPEGVICKTGKPLRVLRFDKRYAVSFKNRNNHDAQHLIIVNY